MRLIGLILLLALTLAPFAGEAQRTNRIGILSTADGPEWDAFREALRGLGYIAGQNIALQYRWHRGEVDRLPSLAAERGRDQLHRLLHTYDLSKWLFTREVLIQSGVIPHSHPVLTLNTRYIEDDIAQLATFVHEQLHWLLTDHVDRAKIDAATNELRTLYPQVPTTLPEGARGEGSTYLHLIVCEPRARQQLERWTHYSGCTGRFSRIPRGLVVWQGVMVWPCLRGKAWRSDRGALRRQ